VIVAEIVLELFIVGHSPNSEAAVTNLSRICEERLAGRFEILICDVLENPQAAEDASIVVTPTLLRRSPLPVRRIVGDLSVTEAVLRGLGIDEDGWDERVDES
jgi:circadian clock protein KaiB